MEAATAIVPITRKLEALVPDQPPVSMVRSAEIWARLAPWALRKTIIIENADAMQESARNALLKILEEPPSTLTFILLTSRRSSVIRTILSRVRTYPFAFRDGASNALVLGKVFRERELGALEGSGPALLSVEAWLAARRPFPPSRAREVAASFVSAVLAGRRAGGASLGPVFERAALEASRAGLDTTQALSLVLSETKDFGQRDEGFETSFQAFLEALEGCLGDFLRDGDMGREDLAWVSRAADLARSVKARKESYNLSPSLLIEGLAYGLSTP
jgi:DNA polymerase-3 subunit gamma/tau